MLISRTQVKTYKLWDPREGKLTRSCGITMDPLRSKCVGL